MVALRAILPGCRKKRGCVVCREFKTLIEPTKSQSAFSSHRALEILNNVSDTILSQLGQVTTLVTPTPPSNLEGLLN